MKDKGRRIKDKYESEFSIIKFPVLNSSFILYPLSFILHFRVNQFAPNVTDERMRFLDVRRS